jgi:hypothetical protein
VAHRPQSSGKSLWSKSRIRSSNQELESSTQAETRDSAVSTTQNRLGSPKIPQKLAENGELEALARRHAEHRRDLFEWAEAVQQTALLLVCANSGIGCEADVRLKNIWVRKNSLSSD